jgi:hypothetical protein
MKKAILAGVVAFAALCSVASNASADPPKKGQDYEYKFTDDKLLADTMGATGAKITVRKPPARDRLLRPRLHFVPEMLKSVENM